MALSPTPVRLYVYEITNGLARQFSPLMIGRQIDGVWHTAVCVFGNEYFFGGDGISYCPPSGTILGHPTEILEMGNTEIPLDVFHEYLTELTSDRFSGAKYHLLDRNCNHFSNELTQFLTGNSIPEKIVGLPAEVLNTPFGQMIRPMVDQMMAYVASHGQHFGDSSQRTENLSDSGNRGAAADQSAKQETETTEKATQNSVGSEEASDDKDKKPSTPNDLDLD